MKGKKRGIKRGTKLATSNKTQDDWYEACNLYRSEYHQMKQSIFLRSSVSGEVFMGSRAEQQVFTKNLKLFDKGELGRGKMLRQRQREFANFKKSS